MIRIKRDDLTQIGVEFYAALSKFLCEDKDYMTRSKLIKKRNKAISDSNFGVAEMIDFYQRNRSRIADIKSTEELHSFTKEFDMKFFDEVLTWICAPLKVSDGSAEVPKSGTQFGKFIKLMEGLYGDFMKSSHPNCSNIGIWLSKKLDIRTCPYCNRHYTFSIEKTGDHSAVRPQFDHFLPKGRYPITALCFFNLIPACADCNKTKGEKVLAIHPYENCFDSLGITFSYDPSSGRRNPTIKISDANHPNVKHLGLSELYQGHSDIVTDLINKAEAYNLGYYSNLVKSFSGLGLTQSEIESAVWGTSLDENEMLNRPFSKFTRDILHQLGKI